jgi:8-oxo-dGTP pyrophosphatase MutT (NUDIX family)
MGRRVSPLPTRVQSPGTGTFRYGDKVPTPPVLHEPFLRERVRANLHAFSRRAHCGANLRAAAVALALVTDRWGNACFLLTRRAEGLRAHGGQWALPGGRIDPGESAADAALRELDEECGLKLDGDCVLGELDDYPTRSGYNITPVVTWVAANATLTANPEEVTAIHRVPLSELDRPDVPRLRAIPESERPVISVPLLGTFIHAPTAALLYQLREVAIHGRDTRVAEYEQPVFAWR